MNHPKGEESTVVGQACSLTYHLSSTALNCGRASPEKLRPGRTFPKGRDLCGGSRPFLFPSWQSETRAAGFVCRMQSDPLDCTDRDDELFELAFLRLDAKRQKAETGLARKRMERQP